MIITPAKFEDEMEEATNGDQAVSVMLETLNSMGYETGVKVFCDRFIGELKDN